MERCSWFWGSHGCDLLVGHTGNHQCLVFEYEEAGDGWVVVGVRDICSEKEQNHPDLFQ